MIADLTKYLPSGIFNLFNKDKSASEAYDLWSADYDAQPGNLMLDLDQVVFERLLEKVTVYNKKIADIGCGTGRHWPMILKKKPAALTGFDVSAGMLKRLEEKFPKADTNQITDNHFLNIAKGTYDVILSTLTVAHIKDLDEALLAWNRILKSNGDIIITDFHPDALASGGKRTFKYQNRHMAVRNFVHKTNLVKSILIAKGFQVAAEEEIKVDESVKHYYEDQNALHVYDRFKGMPIIYGIHFSRG